MNNSVFIQLEHLFAQAVEQIRSQLDGANISAFKFELHSSGRVATGDAKVSFVVGSCEYGTGAKTVESNSIASALEECMRREGFTKSHQMIALPRYANVEVKQPSLSDVIQQANTLAGHDNAQTQKDSDDEISF